MVKLQKEKSWWGNDKFCFNHVGYGFGQRDNARARTQHRKIQKNKKQTNDE